MADEHRPESDVLRLTRDGGDRGPSLAQRLSERLDQLSFASPLHKMRLKGRFPLKLLAVPADPVPGNPHVGQRLKDGQLSFAGYSRPMAQVRFDDAAAPAVWREWVHGWGWLRDMATVQAPVRGQIRRIEALAKYWLERFDQYDPAAWAPAPTGRRIMMAIAHAPSVMPTQDHIHRSAVLNGIARWARHLDRAVPRMAEGIDRIEASAGLIAAALLLPGGEERRPRGETLLMNTLGHLLHPDGSAVTRSPLELAQIGDLLLFLEAFYAARGQRAPLWLTETLDLLRDALSGLAMGDGIPGPWHGGQPTRQTMLRLRATNRLAQPGRDSGYQRLSAGGVIAVVDAGPPPPARLSDNAHASTLALMVSDGPRLLVVSCGGETGASPEGARTLSPELTMGLRSTAGHSTLTLADTNSSRLADGGPRKLGGVEEVLVEIHASEQGQWLECRHDGYQKRFGVEHLRRLYLAPCGEDLRGEDQLLPKPGTISRLRGDDPLPVVIRFHLGPEWTATMAGDGREALIRPIGPRKDEAETEERGWLFRASFNSAPGMLSIEPSLMLDAEGETHIIQQLVLTTTAEPKRATSIGWSFRREE